MNRDSARVDASLNIIGKPYQTALSVLSLLRCSGPRLRRLYLQFETHGSVYDSFLPYEIAAWLEHNAEVEVLVSQPSYWLKREPPDPSRMGDPQYRLSIRYQYAFEHSDADYLFIMHNDVLILKDVIGRLLQDIGPAFAAGPVGQCWNCPARNPSLVRDAGLGDQPCRPESYDLFQPDYAGLQRLYQAAVDRGVFVRPYWEGWETHYSSQGWPLPECRLNEWGCLVNLALNRPLMSPAGPVDPFGAYGACGSVSLDIAVPWFRDMNRLGLRARHVDVRPLLRHWVGNNKMSRSKYLQAEENAHRILERQYPEFVGWCRAKKNGYF